MKPPTICMKLNEKHRHKSYQNILQKKNNFEPLQSQDPSEIPTESASTQKLPLIDDELQSHPTINKDTNIPILLLSSNLTLKTKRHMYFFPMDSEKLTLDGLIDTGAFTSAISLDPKMPCKPTYCQIFTQVEEGTCFHGIDVFRHTYWLIFLRMHHQSL